MAPTIASTTPTTAPRPAAAKRRSTLIRLPSFAPTPKHTAELDTEAELVSLWPRPRARRASSTSSISSTSSTSSSSSTSSAMSSGSASSSSGSGAMPSAKNSKSRKVRVIISGVSSLLIMPMPFLERGSPQPPTPPSATSAADPALPRPRARRFSLPSLPSLSARPTRPAKRPTHRKRNSLVLPEVSMREEPASPLDSTCTSSCIRPPSCTIRDLPPPLAVRTVRFVLPPPKFAPPIDWPGDRDEEPAWSDFM
ncbi:hypothetical protein DFH09DRAFT_1418176 [Mycena vulgaris]|nr:hypothetical protein DFH09DRAFT_1418176 [Mycena vulgaris]